MEDILKKLTDYANVRVAEYKKEIPEEEMRDRAEALGRLTGNCGRIFPFETALRGEGIHFICECKKSSPSKGLIAPDFPYVKIAESYEAAGASAISVLTEPKWFLGSDDYLKEIVSHTSVPVLRKDFTVDPYMIYQAKTFGASAVLLICAVLPEEELREDIAICDSLGLSALVEAHDEREVSQAVRAGARVIGVNNRNLRDFTVDIHNSIRLRELAPEDTIFVAESGIHSPEAVEELREHHVNAVLIGEQLMRAEDPGKELGRLRGTSMQEPLATHRDMRTDLPEAETERGERNAPGKSRRTFVKICGLRRRADGDIVNRAKPDYAGFIFAPGRRRYIDPEEAEEIREALDPRIQSVGVFVNASPEEIQKIHRICPTDLIQLHGQETEEEIQTLRKLLPPTGIIKAFSLGGTATEDRETLEQAARSPADLLLFDHGRGGSGASFDWSVLAGFRRPYLLAGGISEENVNQALEALRPYGVDVSSSLETDGYKDEEKVKRFMGRLSDAGKGGQDG